MSRKKSRVSYDMHDSEKDLRSYPLLRNALEECHRIEQGFLGSDEAAISNQSLHKMIVAAAAICGTLAVILAILQLAISSMPLATSGREVVITILMAGEGLTIAVAVVAVLCGVLGHVHENWLEHRHRAEQYRFLKFASLINPDLLSVDQEDTRAWRRTLDDAMTEVVKSSAHDWAVDENTHSRPPILKQSMVSTDGLRELIEYYFQKRLRIQKHYFGRQARRHDRSNWYTRLPPPIFFFVSVAFALLHTLIEGVSRLRGNHPTDLHQEATIAVIFIAAAAILPVLGGGIRTARAAFEFSRQTLRFRAKYSALLKLEESLEQRKEKLTELKSGPQCETELAEEIYGDLWMCERVLESERREWLRLMIEAEWFA